MTITIDKPTDNAGNPAKPLATEGPLAEKDEQGMAIEHHRRLAAEALAKWHRLKEKIRGAFKK